jgi:hypothetical protein
MYFAQYGKVKAASGKRGRIRIVVFPVNPEKENNVSPLYISTKKRGLLQMRGEIFEKK